MRTLLFSCGILFQLGANWAGLLTSPLTTAPKEPRARPENHEDRNRASYRHTGNHPDTDGIPLIERRCEWRAGSTSRLGVVAYRTGRDVVPWYSVLLTKTKNVKNV